MRVARAGVSIGLVLVTVAGTAAEPVRTCPVTSGPERRPVLELYTSEGCSSCPPADQWLSRTFSAGGEAAGRIVPLAFHVDYWNALGWPDRFARPEFTSRQQLAARRARASAIYTPQFVFDGRDIRPHAFARDILARSAAADTARASISGEISVVRGQQLGWSGTVRTSAGSPGVQAWVALYQNDLRSRVKAGENAGRWLRHDFVVREWSGPFLPDAEGRIDIRAAWAWPVEFRDAQGGIAIVVEDAGSGATLQAVASPLCNG